MEQQVADAGMEERVTFVGAQPQNEQMSYYDQIDLLLMPSRSEGFGLPILEAMACGCLSVTCRNSSLPEVGGDIAIYVDEPIEDNLGIMLQQIDKNEIDTSVRQRDGIVWASKFSWESATRQTADVYMNLMNVY